MFNGIVRIVAYDEEITIERTPLNITLISQSGRDKTAKRKSYLIIIQTVRIFTS